MTTHLARRCAVFLVPFLSFGFFSGCATADPNEQSRTTMFAEINAEPAGDYYHWHVEIIPRITRVAGFEWGTGFFINPTPPEEAAEYLRGEVPDGP